MELYQYFDNILDLPAVDGLLVMRPDGTTALDRLPPFIPRETLGDIVRRIAALYATVDENFLPCDDYLLKYPDKWLIFRRNRDAILLLMVDPSVNLVSLKMVCNLALKNTDAGTMETLGTAPHRPAVPAAAPAPPAPPPELIASAAQSAPSPSTTTRVIRRSSRTYRGTSY